MSKPKPTKSSFERANLCDSTSPLSEEESSFLSALLRDWPSERVKNKLKERFELNKYQRPGTQRHFNDLWLSDHLPKTTRNVKSMNLANLMEVWYRAHPDRRDEFHLPEARDEDLPRIIFQARKLLNEMTDNPFFLCQEAMLEHFEFLCLINEQESLGYRILFCEERPGDHAGGYLLILREGVSVEQIPIVDEYTNSTGEKCTKINAVIYVIGGKIFVNLHLPIKGTREAFQKIIAELVRMEIRNAIFCGDFNLLGHQVLTEFGKEGCSASIVDASVPEIPREQSNAREICHMVSVHLPEYHVSSSELELSCASACASECASTSSNTSVGNGAWHGGGGGGRSSAPAPAPTSPVWARASASADNNNGRNRGEGGGISSASASAPAPTSTSPSSVWARASAPADNNDGWDRGRGGSSNSKW